VIFLAGDSSLDNKHWFPNTNKSCNGYETILNPPKSKEDVCYFINKEIERMNLTEEYVSINCAVETSRIESRNGCNGLLEHDQLIHENLSNTNDDILIVSVGGNDIALGPTPCTICNILSLILLTPNFCLDYGCKCNYIPTTNLYLKGKCNYLFDDYCYGCSTSCLSSLGLGGFCSFPLGLGYFIHLFKTRIENYIQKLISGQNKPSLILICMIYYPEEFSLHSQSNKTYSWADPALSALGYNSNPKKLQKLIQLVYEYAIKDIKIINTNTNKYIKVIPIPMFDIINSKPCNNNNNDSNNKKKQMNDLCYRVEPSPKGGEKLAKCFMEYIINSNTVNNNNN